MNAPTRLTTLKSVLFALGCALGLSLIASAADAPAAAAKAPALPVTATFAKASGVEGAPFTLTLTNTSKADLKVSGKVLLSVQQHNADKFRAIDAMVLKPGAMQTVKGLAALDKVILHADGFAPLELTVK
ncbi:MAG: hypothetical protein WCR49_04680 [Opitutae bacterium]